MIFLNLEDLLAVARRTLGDVEIRDVGLLQSASARPRSTAFGEDAYLSIQSKAAALLRSINERLALAATIAFYSLNGLRLTMPDDEAYDLIMAVAAGHLTTSTRSPTAWSPAPPPGPDVVRLEASTPDLRSP